MIRISSLELFDVVEHRGVEGTVVAKSPYGVQIRWDNGILGNFPNHGMIIEKELTLKIWSTYSVLEFSGNSCKTIFNSSNSCEADSFWARKVNRQNCRIVKQRIYKGEVILTETVSYTIPASY